VRRVVLASASDEELLLAVASRCDEDAFEALLRRHGPMVWAVCRRVLRHTQDAEDAFQATFLVLIRKAGAIQKRASLPSWLHGVAYRTSRKAQVMKARRLVHESRAVSRAITAEADDHSDLDFEVNALPEKYRLPVLLCELQGRTRKEAAELLKIPEGTLSSRLAAARKTLAQRLRLRGACFVAGAAAPARVPVPLVMSTVKAVGLVLSGGEAAGVVSANAVVLSQGVLQAMFLIKVKSVVVAAVVLGSLGIGAGKYAYTGVAAGAVAGDEPGGQTSRPASGSDLGRLEEELGKLKARLREEMLTTEKLNLDLASIAAAQKGYRDRQAQLKYEQSNS
jgi:RNA polymerase sigma factor (sigma-70 family)